MGLDNLRRSILSLMIFGYNLQLICKILLDLLKLLCRIEELQILSCLEINVLYGKKGNSNSLSFVRTISIC